MACGAGGYVWAHEFGHTRGLQHNDADNQNFMHSIAIPTCKLDEMECGAFHSGADVRIRKLKFVMKS